jgi:hypothetical protein
MRNLRWLGVLWLIAFTSCEQIIDVDLNTIEPKIVIEGWVTDQGSPLQVRITKTGNYTDTSSLPKVSGALVWVQENGLISDTLEEVRPGVYRTAEPYVGVVGNTYQIFVEYEGNLFTGLDKMHEVFEIDSLTYKLDTTTAELPEDEYRYKVALHFQEIPGLGNHYWYRYYKNNRAVQVDDFIVFSDEFFDGFYISDIESIG